MVNWTEVILAIITTAGTVITAIYANLARGSATSASIHADIATKASMGPPPMASINPPPPNEVITHSDMKTPVEGTVRGSGQA